MASLATEERGRRIAGRLLSLARALHTQYQRERERVELRIKESEREGRVADTDSESNYTGSSSIKLILSFCLSVSLCLFPHSFFPFSRSRYCFSHRLPPPFSSFSSLLASLVSLSLACLLSVSALLSCPPVLPSFRNRVHRPAREQQQQQERKQQVSVTDRSRFPSLAHTQALVCTTEAAVLTRLSSSSYEPPSVTYSSDALFTQSCVSRASRVASTHSAPVSSFSRALSPP